MLKRPRRNRKSKAIRNLIKETFVSPEDLILPLFLKEGKNIKEPISALPDSFVLSLDEALKVVKKALNLGVSGVLLFPQIEFQLKDPMASESWNEDGLLQRGIREIKNAFPDVLIFSDVAMDPYSSDGHDGILKKGKICNDETLEILARMALSQARAGVDFIAPSDMMDGRVHFLRKALDEEGFTEVGILSYSAKYASSLYGPFREILKSDPKILKETLQKKKSIGEKKNALNQSLKDKKTYQMDPSNQREALREGILDQEEGADILMVKPALFYLDVIYALKRETTLPIAAYLVSGEEAMIYAASKKGLLDSNAVLMEAITAIKRAGADMILTYSALKIAKEIHNESSTIT